VVDESLAADSHRCNVATAGGETLAHQIVRAIFAGPGEEPALERELADSQRLIEFFAAAHQSDDLDLIAIGKPAPGLVVAADDLLVDFDGNSFGIAAQFPKQIGNRQLPIETTRFFVDRDVRHDEALRAAQVSGFIGQDTKMAAGEPGT
jgi:hypothetical protein